MVTCCHCSLCAFIITSAGGPFLCSNKGPTLIQELSPAYLRARVGSSVSWSCEAVGETLPKYHWSKDCKVTLKIHDMHDGLPVANKFINYFTVFSDKNVHAC